MRHILMERSAGWNPALWLWRNMDRRDRVLHIVPIISGLVALIISLLGSIFAGHGAGGIVAFPLLIIMVGYFNGILSVLKLQERRLQALESKQTSEDETVQGPS